MDVIIFPFDIINLIFEFDGRIKYKHKEKIYVNIISKIDFRYNLIKPKLISKNNIVKNMYNGLNGSKFYIDINFKNDEIFKGLVFSKKLL